jgi:hypothetical protein
MIARGRRSAKGKTAISGFGLVLSAIVMVAVCIGARAQNSAPASKFEVSFPASVHSEAITGRLFLMISRTNKPEVRLQPTWVTSPEIIAINVRQMKPGQFAVVDEHAPGTPLTSLSKIPPGDYFVQAVLNLYTDFHRADGRIVWAHMDHWEGQQFNRSPGNLFSKVRKLRIDRSRTYKLTLSEVIPEFPALTDTPWVRYVKIQSKLLTQFWGRPIYLGAVVLLPRGYDTTRDVKYPVIYFQPGHFSLIPPFGFRTDNPPESDDIRQERLSRGFESGYEFQQAWCSDHFPRMIAVSLLHPTPFGDMSGATNSVNNGPYEDAIVGELIPYVEQAFRVIREPYARTLVGRALGARDALTLQLHHAEFFGGAWMFSPWAFNFRRYFALDIYDDENAFVVNPKSLQTLFRNPSSWFPIERVFARTEDGMPVATFRQTSQHDLVMAGMAGGDTIGIDDAILGPVGADGYPKRLWDRSTGKIDHEVAEHWREHGDLAYYAQTNWPKTGRFLVGKLNFYMGDMDIFYRNYGVHLFEEFLRSSENPHYVGTFVYKPLNNGWQPMTNAQLVRIMADHIAGNAPPEAGPEWQSD